MAKTTAPARRGGQAAAERPRPQPAPVEHRREAQWTIAPLTRANAAPGEPPPVGRATPYAQPLNLTCVPVHPPAPSVGLVLQRKCATCNTPMNGECEKCAGESLQAKLRIGSAGDAFEAEADRVAERVVDGGGAPKAAEARAVAPVVQRLAPSAPSAVAEAPPIVGDVLSSSGEPLDRATRGFFEPRFAHDFSRIRVHTDPAAAASARSVGALAYTVSDHIVFDSAQFSPGTSHGRRLLAHELTHTIQQGAGHAAPYVARQPNPSPANEEMEVVAGEATADPSDAPWFVYNDGKGDKRKLLPSGTRVQTQGAPIVDVRGTQRITLRRVKVISLPADEKDPALGMAGMLQTKFLRAVEVAPKAEPKPAPAPEKPAADADAATATPAAPSQEQRVLDRYNALPSSAKWPNAMWKSRKRSPKTDLVIQVWSAARDFVCNQPYDVDFAMKIYAGMDRAFLQVYLTDSNFEKKYANLNGVARTNLYAYSFLPARSAIKRPLSDLKTGQSSAGQCGGEWDYYYTMLTASYEMMAVLAGDLAIEDAPNITAYDKISSFKPASAFASGLLAGAKGQLSDEDYKRLSEKLGDASIITVFAPPIILAGAGVGIAKDLFDILKLVYTVLVEPEKIGEMVEQLLQMIAILMTDEEGSRALGMALGASQAQSLIDFSKENAVKFTYKLGEKVGPMIIYAVLAIFGGEIAAAVRGSAELAAFLEKYPGVAKNLERLKALMPAKKAVPVAEGAEEAKAASKAVPKKVPAAAAGAGAEEKVAAGAGAEEAKAAGQAAKTFSEAETKTLKELAKDGKQFRKVTDKQLLKDGYELEATVEKKTYRRKGDGTWCIFASPADCGYKDPEVDAELMKIFRREMAVAAGWAIEDYVLSLGYDRPRPFNFPGIDGWKRAVSKGGKVIEADVVQIKSMSDLKHSSVIEQINSGTKGLARTAFSDGTITVKARSSTLAMVFEQDTWANLGLSQQEALMKQVMSTTKSFTEITVEWYYFAHGKLFRIPL